MLATATSGAPFFNRRRETEEKDGEETPSSSEMPPDELSWPLALPLLSPPPALPLLLLLLLLLLLPSRVFRGLVLLPSTLIMRSSSMSLTACSKASPMFFFA